MDSLTHIIVGAALGDTLLKKKIGRWGAVIGAFLNSFPDFDLLISGLTDPKKYIVFHRAHTHALFYQFFYCFALAGIFYWIFKKRNSIPYQKWLLITFALVFSHSLMDICTNYGTRLFLPFSRELIAFNSMAILDLVLTIPILILLIIGLSFRNNSPMRHSFITVLLIYTVGYFSYSFVNKNMANNALKKSLATNQRNYTNYMSNPTILNNFLWYGIATTDDSLFIAEYTLLKQDKELIWTAFPRHRELVERYPGKEDAELLKWFSQGFYLAEQRQDTLDFYAVKFGRNNFEANTPKESFMFHYSLYKKDNKFKFTAAKPSNETVDFGKAFKELLEKIKGK